MTPRSLAGRLAALLALALTAATLGMVTAPPAVAAAPGNDDVANATVLLTTGTSNTTTLDATLQGGESSSCAPIGHSVWFRFDAPSNDVLRVRTLLTTGSPANLDTVVGVFTSSTSTPSIGSLTEVTCNDQSGGNLSDIAFAMTSGTTYYIQVADYVGPGSGSEQAPVQLSLSSSAPPANDDVATPTTIAPGSPLTASTDFASLQAGEDDNGDCGNLYNSVWFRWTPAASTLADVTTTAAAPGAASVVTVYSGSSATIAGLTPLACGADSAQVSAVAGTAYYIQVSDQGGPDAHASPGTRQVLLSAGTPPANDALAGATPIASPSTSAVDNLLATSQAGEPQPACTPGYQLLRSVWFKITAAGTGPLSLATIDPEGADTDLGIYSGPASGATFASLVAVGCDDDGGPGLLSQLTVPVVAGTTYYVQVGTTAGGGTFQLAASGAGAPAPSGTTTSLSVPKKVTVGRKATISVAVRTTSGAPASGTVTITLAGRSTTLTLVNGTARLTSKKLRKVGKVTVTAAYAATATTQASSATSKFKVRKPRRR